MDKYKINAPDENISDTEIYRSVEDIKSKTDHIESEKSRIRTLVDDTFDIGLYETDESALTGVPSELADFDKIAFDSLMELGVNLESIGKAFKNIAFKDNSTGETLYRRIDSLGGQLSECKDGSGFIGSVIKEGKMGQARFEVVNMPVTPPPIAVDPMTLFIALATMEIEQTMREVQEDVRNILDFLEKKEQSELYGTYNALMEIKDDFRFNRDNTIAIQSYHAKVRDILHSSQEKIVFHKKLTKDAIIKYKKIFNPVQISSATDDMAKKLQSRISDYKMALTNYAFAYLLDVMITGNFDSAYLNNICTKIGVINSTYNNIYDECIKLISKSEKKEIDRLGIAAAGSALRTVGRAADFVGKGIGKGLDKVNIHVKAPNPAKTLGQKVSRKAVSMKNDTFLEFRGNEENGTSIFIDAIQTIDTLYNKPLELTADDNYLYYRTAAAESNSLV